MPKSSLMGLRWVLAPAAAIVAAAACCPPAGADRRAESRSSSRATLPTGPLDYQVALIRNDRPARSPGNSAAARSATTRVTIAHRHRGALRVRQHRDGPGPADRSGESRRPRREADVADAARRRTDVHVVGASRSTRPSTLPPSRTTRPCSRSRRRSTERARQPIDFVDRRSVGAAAGKHRRRGQRLGPDRGGTYPNDLRWAEMPFADRFQLPIELGRTRASTRRSRCAPAGRGVDSCFGDSGGPLVVDSTTPSATSTTRCWPGS